MKKSTRLKLTIKSIIKYPSISNRIENINSNIFFLFPYYETGGAEQVHYDIMKSVQDQNPTCFITHTSTNSDMKEKFKSVSNMIELYRWGWKKSFKQKMLIKIAKKINSTPNAIIFSSNSPFFYEILKYISKDVKVIDLIHTYLADIEEHCFERFSLPYIDRIDERIVLGYKHRDQLIGFLKEQQVKKIPKISIIPNKIEINHDTIIKDFSRPFEVLFVARNAVEKRPHIFIEITKICAQQNLPIKFKMIGDFEEFENIVGENVEITGRIKSKTELNKHYKNAHAILITSLFEGFPMVLLEGMAWGCIPISTEVGDVPTHINTQNSTGFIIQESTNEDIIILNFVSTLKNILQDYETAGKISQNVQNLVRTKFSEESFRKNYRELLIRSH